MVKDVTSLESAQRKAARFVTGNKETDEECMTRLLQELEWSPLAYRRKFHRLTVLYMAIQEEIAIEMPLACNQQSSLYT